MDRLRPKPKVKIMHDLLIALAFIGMVIAPALIAATSGIGEPVEDSD